MGFTIWQDVPVLVMVSMLAYFCFLEQLLLILVTRLSNAWKVIPKQGFCSLHLILLELHIKCLYHLECKVGFGLKAVYRLEDQIQIKNKMVIVGRWHGSALIWRLVDEWQSKLMRPESEGATG
ncbi:hypothetical protein CsSME_00017955 [Camellia sinensis var. sinensis]